MNIDDFILKTKNEPNKWINYCEILIDTDGDIIICNPSHTESCIQYAMRKDNITREDIRKTMIPFDCLVIDFIVDKYQIIALWYHGYKYSSMGLTEEQKVVLQKLEDNKLLTSKEYQINSETSEYYSFLRRVEFGIPPVFLDDIGKKQSFSAVSKLLARKEKYLSRQ